jgi:hypothetical protein
MHKYSLFLDSIDRGVYPTPPTFAEYLAMTFGDLCERGAEVGATAVFMSLGDILQSTDHEFYASVKNTGLGTDRYIADFDVADASGVVDGSYGVYVLSDFTDKYHNLDWISGGGVSSFTTEHSGVFSDAYGRYSRVLRSSIDTVGVAGAAGLILRNLRGTTDLSDTKVVFDFSVHGDVEAEDLTVVFVFGADDNRAEFDAGKIVLGEACAITCDLGEYEYASAVDYIGVMIYSENSVDFDISKVTVCSDTKTADELYELFYPTENAKDRTLDKYVVIVVIFIVAVISIVGGILLLRRDREDVETAERKNDRRNSNGRQK